MPENTIDERIAAYLSGNLDPAERRTLMTWVEANRANQAYFDQAVSLWALAQEYEPATRVDTTTAWERFSERIDEQDEAPEPTRPILMQPKLSGRWFAIAATFLLLASFSFWWFYMDHAMQVKTMAAEQQKIELPDGTEVWLNENSVLRYDARFRERTIALEGEAYFMVAKDSLHPFTVHTGQAATRVLGTSFNVRAYPAEEEVVVTVQTGKVVLEDENEPDDRVELTSGQSGVFSKPADKVVAEPQQISNALAWKEQRLDFVHTPLKEVLPTLERFFGQKIVVSNPAILNCTLFGKHPHPDLDSILASMAFSIDLEVDRSQPGQILLSGPGCN